MRLYRGHLYDHLKGPAQGLQLLRGLLYDRLFVGWILKAAAGRPLADEEWATGEIPFAADYHHRDGTAGLLRVQADTDSAFGSGNLQEGTTSVASGTRGTVPLTCAATGTWYYRIRAEAGGEVSTWLESSFVRVATQSLNMVTPLGGRVVDVAPLPFSAHAHAGDGSSCRMLLELDTGDTFDGVDLVQLSTDLAATGGLHELSHAFTGAANWYWRASAQAEGGAQSPWLGPYLLEVDTGGLMPADYNPKPTNTILIEIGTLLATWSAVLSHIQTPTVGPTLRLQVQRDTDPAFPTPVTETSTRVMNGERATVSMAQAVPGDYWVRFRTLSDTGPDSPWSAYQVTAEFRTAFTREPSWQGQIGPRPNRVFCRIDGGTTYQTAETAGVAPQDRVDYWVVVPAGTSTAEALGTAQAALGVLQGRSVSVSGQVPITIVAAFGRLVRVQWWEIAAGVPALREEQVLILAKKQHNVDQGTTELHLGDYAPPPEETLARTIAKLSRG